MNPKNDLPDDEFLELLNAHRWQQNRFANRDLLHSLYLPYNSRITRALLKDKHVVFIGDSLVRAMYKDLLSLIQTGNLCDAIGLRVPNEDTIHGDRQIDFLDLDANRVFRQAREFQSNRHLIQYFFTNRAMREDLEKTCLMMEATDEKPDVVVINSAIWDVSRYPARHGQRNASDATSELVEEINVAEEYYNRIAMFCRRMRVLLPPTSTVVWLLMPPSCASKSNRGFFSYNHLRFDEIRMRLLEVNVRAAQIVREAGFDVLDLSFHMRLSNYHVFRVKDGVHFDTAATRYMNQLLLGHLASAWRLDKTIMRKWAPNIQEKISRETRSPYFIKALEFLKNMNDNKHLNERVHQKVRSVALANFDSQLKFYNSMPIEQIMHWMRTLLMFQKCESLNRNQSILFNNAFQTMPAELSRFSEDDIVEINRMIEDISGGWMTCAPNIRLSYSQKRSRKTVVEEPEQKGIPNRIAEPEEKKSKKKRKRARHSISAPQIYQINPHAENSTDHRPEPGKNARVRGQHRGRGKRGAGPRGDLRRVHPASRRPSESRGTQMRELRKREPARDESAPAEDSASEVTQVRGNSELPRIPREKDLLEEIGSYCEACEEFGHSIDVCHVYPHAEARYERLLSLKLCIRCGQSHPDECQEQTRACRACGNNRHMYALCHRRYGKEVIAARQLRDKAAASKSRKKRSRRQAFTSGAALSQTNSNGLQAQKPGAGVPRKRRRRPSFPKKSRSSR